MSKIVVIGAGTMGAGIAFVAAAAGYDVDLIEPDAAASDLAKARIAKDAERAKQPDVPRRVQFYTALQTGAQADAVIEAVPEQIGLKHDVFAQMAKIFDAQTLLCTNTSSFSVEDIAGAVPSPERVIGLHFFNPPAAMKLVEIVHTEQTSQEAIDRARAFVERLGKTAVLAADTPGFIVNRVARPYYLQAMRAYEAGVAPVADLDRLARGAGFRMGPFELIDLIGMDVNLATSQSVYERTGAERFEPVAVQREMVAQGRLGRKSGAGFFDYSQGPPSHDEGVPDESGEVNNDEHVVILGFEGLAGEVYQRVRRCYANAELWEDEETLRDIPPEATVVFDVGDGVSDRTNLIELLDAQLPPEAVIFVDAYATDLHMLAKRLEHPERVVGYGILASLEQQRVVEIVDGDHTSDDALELAQEFFESIGRGVVLVEEHPGLFLGRTVGSIVNEAVYVVQEEIAGADDVDVAMRLGTNYPMGPIEWGRAIGGDRVARILQRLAAEEGSAFGPSRALWVLDAQSPEEVQPEETDTFLGVPLHG